MSEKRVEASDQALAQAVEALKRVIPAIEAHWEGAVDKRHPSPAQYGELWAAHDQAAAALTQLQPEEEPYA